MTVSDVKILPPPMALMQDIEEPEMQGNTNKDLILWAVRMREAVMRANANLKALREWADGRAQ